MGPTEEFKNRFSLIPLIVMIDIGMKVGVRRGRLMFRDFSDKVAERVIKIPSVMNELEDKYPHIFKAK